MLSVEHGKIRSFINMCQRSKKLLYYLISRVQGFQLDNQFSAGKNNVDSTLLFRIICCYKLFSLRKGIAMKDTRQ